MSENMGAKRLTIMDIETKQFRRVAYGYEQREVDEFLDSICDEMELLQSEIDDLRHKLDFANAETRKAEAAGGVVAPASAAPDASFREILEMAQRVKDQTIADAKTKAEEIVAEAQARAEAELGSLQEEKDTLQQQVDELKTTGSQYRERFLQLIQEHKEILDRLAVDD